MLLSRCRQVGCGIVRFVGIDGKFSPVYLAQFVSELFSEVHSLSDKQNKFTCCTNGLCVPDCTLLDMVMRCKLTCSSLWVQFTLQAGGCTGESCTSNGRLGIYSLLDGYLASLRFPIIHQVHAIWTQSIIIIDIT